MTGDLKPGIDTFEFYPLPRAISKFQYGTRPQTKPNERRKKNNSEKEIFWANERTQPGFIL